MHVSNPSSSFSNEEYLAVDANTGSVGGALDVSEALNVVMEVRANSGTHGTHVVTLQCSLNGTDWNDTSFSVSGLGVVEGTINALYARPRVSTSEGASSTVDIHIQAK